MQAQDQAECRKRSHMKYREARRGHEHAEVIKKPRFEEENNRSRMEKGWLIKKRGAKRHE